MAFRGRGRLAITEARTGVDGAVVDADHAEVHERHGQADGQGRERGHVEHLVTALRVDGAEDREDQHEGAW